MSLNWKYDVSVLLIFFVRDDVFAKTFEAVRKARPRRLLLYQDGPRDGRKDDVKGIKRCRKIAENIDWDCEVYKNYQKKNWGCDPATFYSHKWAFSIVNKCIILEDDFVVSESFFPLCENLLNKYENDNRINRICGANTLGVLEGCPYDYFFSLNGVGGVWATWKRVADEWDENYDFLNDRYHINQLRKTEGKRTFDKYYRLAQRHKKSGNPHWETIVSFNQILNSRLNIIVAKNMVNNIGIGDNSTHTELPFNQMPRKLKRLYTVPVYELQGNLKHPPYVVANKDFYIQYQELMGNNLTLPHKVFLQANSVFLRLIHGNFKSILKGIQRRLN